ncbi:hypothetical protein KOW79_001868 [Hemibagrus wyckioides]|uniref:Ig-like domain-containing protein n=1 Tax=Hemibagrus wyckioides TaxID=337641 RepID=A0A9D3SSQ5_9TELE|nr:hypothetical protein KOW79_001868 [Hemibagrus wyckioides]
MSWSLLLLLISFVPYVHCISLTSSLDEDRDYCRLQIAGTKTERLLDRRELTRTPCCKEWTFRSVWQSIHCQKLEDSHQLLWNKDMVSFLTTWTDASGNALTDVVQYPAVRATGGFASVSRVRVNASDWDQKKTYTCTAQNGAGLKEATLQKPEVAELSASLLLLAPTQKDIDNGTATFVCLATQFFPKKHEFKWSHEKKDLNNTVKATMLSKDKGVYTAVSVLVMNSSDWLGSSFPVKCEFKQEKKTVSKEASYVSLDTHQPEVHITPPSTRDMLIKRSGDLVCTAAGEHGFKEIKWLSGNKELPSVKDSNLHMKTTIKATIKISYTEWSSGSTFTCQVYHNSFPLEFKNFNFKREEDCPMLTEIFQHEMEMDEDNMANIALTFVFLFLFSLFYSIGVTAVKVK